MWFLETGFLVIFGYVLAYYIPQVSCVQSRFSCQFQRILEILLQAPVVQRVDSSILRLNHYPLDT